MAEAKEKATTELPDMASGYRDRDLRAIAEMFEFRTPSAVHEFLAAKPQVIQFLLSVPGQVERYFGESRMILDLREYPDGSSTSPPELFVYIVTCLSPHEAWERMCDLDEQWLFGLTEDYPVSLDVEFA